eukprot:1136973-Pelagomonas_calceolata.AAC.13
MKQQFNGQGRTSAIQRQEATIQRLQEATIQKGMKQQFNGQGRTSCHTSSKYQKKHLGNTRGCSLPNREQHGSASLLEHVVAPPKHMPCV